MKKSRTIIIIIGIVLFISVAGFLSYQCILPVFVNYLINASRSFLEKREPSHDGVLELRQYSKDDEDGVNSLYFYVTKKGESTPLFISDCEYRLFDFHVLKWGKGTYDIWAASGDIGTFCYLYTGEGKWVRCGVDDGVKSTDEMWKLTDINENWEYGQGRQIEREKVPQEVIDYFIEWEAK